MLFTNISIYSIALFLHILGALGFFAALGLQWASLSFLRQALTVEQARLWLSMFGAQRRIQPIAWLAILIPGIYMALTAWRGVAWTSIALAAVVLIAVIGPALSGKRMAAIGRSVAEGSGLLHQRLDDPLIWASLRLQTAIALGIVFLMTVKPGLPGSLLTVGVAIVLGLIFSLPAMRRASENVQPDRAIDSH